MRQGGESREVKSQRTRKRCDLTSTETVRLIRDGEKGEGGMEVGGEGDHIPIDTLSPPE